MSILDNNVYWIKSIHSGKCLDISEQKGKKSGSLIIYQYANQPNQQFMVKKIQNSYLLISNKTGKALSIEGNPNDNGSSLRQMENIKGQNQRWRLLQTEPNSGQYVIAALLSDKVLDVCQQKKSNGTTVFLYDYKKSHNQIWQFIHADDGDYPLKFMGSKQGIINHSCFFSKDSL